MNLYFFLVFKYIIERPKLTPSTDFLIEAVYQFIFSPNRPLEDITFLDVTQRSVDVYQRSGGTYCL
jgi:hypothetical protein